MRFQTVLGKAQAWVGSRWLFLQPERRKAPLKLQAHIWGEMVVLTSSGRWLENQQGWETSRGGESQRVSAWAVRGEPARGRRRRHLSAQSVLNTVTHRSNILLVFGVVGRNHCQTSRCLKQHQASAASQIIHTLHAHCNLKCFSRNIAFC